MSDAAYVEEASGWASALTRAESRGPGDHKRAMRRVAKISGVTPATIWALHYRPPKSLLVSVYFKLQAAYDSMLLNQATKLEQQIERRKAAGSTSGYLSQAEGLVRRTRGEGE